MKNLGYIIFLIAKKEGIFHSKQSLFFLSRLWTWGCPQHSSQ